MNSRMDIGCGLVLPATSVQVHFFSRTCLSVTGMFLEEVQHAQSVEVKKKMQAVPWYVTEALANPTVEKYGSPMSWHKATSGARGMGRAIASGYKRVKDAAAFFSPRKKQKRSSSMVSRRSSRSSRMSIDTPSYYSRYGGAGGGGGFHVHARSRVVTTKKRRKSTRRKKSLKKRVAVLERNQPKLATHDYRRLDSGSLANAINQCNYLILSAYTIGVRETAIDALKYMDRAATPAPDDINLTNTGLAAGIHFKDIYTKLLVRNNNSIPCDVDIYCLKSKEAQSDTPIQSMTGSDAKYGITDAQTNILCHPSDFDGFKNSWNIIKHQKARLQSGDELCQVYTQKKGIYDPENADDEAESYIRGDIVWLVRLQGICAHDTTTEENVAYADAQVDVINHMKMKVSYPSDAPFYQIETDNNMSGVAAAEVAGPNVAPSLVDDHN